MFPNEIKKFPIEFKMFPNEIKKFPIEFKVFPIEIKMFVIFIKNILKTDRLILERISAA